MKMSDLEKVFTNYFFGSEGNDEGKFYPEEFRDYCFGASGLSECDKYVRYKVIIANASEQENINNADIVDNCNISSLLTYKELMSYLKQHIDIDTVRRTSSTGRATLMKAYEFKWLITSTEYAIVNKMWEEIGYVKIVPIEMFKGVLGGHLTY